MQLLPFLQHFDKPVDSFGPSISFLSGLNSEKNGISVRTIEGGEKVFRSRISI
jgi:hypothetical protein